jgi:PAS domain S-box-containing protein
LAIQNIIPAALMLLSGLLSTGAAIYTYRRSSSLENRYFMGLMAAVSVWAICAAIEFLAIPYATKIFWGSLSYLGVVNIGPLWLNFALHYTHGKNFRRFGPSYLFWVIPILTLIAVLTNPLHQLFWTEITPINSQPGATLVYAHGWMFWVIVLYTYLLILAGAHLLIHHALSSHRLYRFQVAILVIGVIVPMLGNLASNLNWLGMPGLDLTPLAFAVSGICFVLGVLKFGLTALNPVAREKLIELMSDGVLVLSAEDRIADINPAGERLLGISSGVAVGRLLSELLPQYLPIIEKYRHIYEEKTELHLVDGRFIDLTITPLNDSKQNYGGRLILLRDISAGKKAELDLAQERDFFAQVMSATQNGIVVTDADQRFVYTNRAFGRLAEMEAEKALGRYMIDFIDPAFRPALMEQFERRRRGEVSVYETHLLHADDTVIPVLISAVPRVIDGRNSGSIAVMTDLSELKQIEQTLAAREAFENELIELSAEFVQVSLETQDQLFNYALKRIGSFCKVDRSYVFEFDPAEKTMSNTYEWTVSSVESQQPQLQNVPLEDFPCWMEKLSNRETIYIQNVAQLDEDWQAEKAILSSQNIISLVAVPITTANDVLGFIGFDSVRMERIWREEELHLLRVLTDFFASALTRLRAERELIESNRQLEKSIGLSRQMAAEAEAANRAKSQFIANISHEIRTPMNGIVGLVEILSETRLSVEQYQITQKVAQSADSLLAIINDILDFSKIEVGKFDISEREFDFPSLVEDLGEIFGLRAQEKGLELILDISKNIPYRLSGDPERIRQIFTNLVGNALKFTFQGDVVVSAHVERMMKYSVVLRCEVRDTGIGIAPEGLPHLFKPFSQANASIASKFSGTGLGLSICKELVHMMGGQIGVDSQLGEGSTFWFTLKLGRCLATEKVTTTLPPVLPCVKLMLIEDNANQRHVLEQHIRGFGCEPVSVDTPENALPLIVAAVEHEAPFQILIVKQEQYRQYENQINQAVLLSHQLPATRIILMTTLYGQLHPQMRENALVAGVLVKPIRERHLFNSLFSLVTNQESRLEQLHNASPFMPMPKGMFVERDFKLNKRILLVEDNVINQEVALTILKKRGFQVEAIENGRLAIEKLTSETFDLVLMDLHMPEMSGLEATQIIRDPKSAVLDHQVPVLAMTANAIREIQAQCQQAGMNDYISKPFQSAELVAKVLQWTDMSDVPAREKPGPEKSDASEHKVTPAELDGCVIAFDELVKRVMGDIEIAMELLTQAIERLPADVREIDKAIQTHDARQVAMTAHKLKGGAGNLAAEVLRDLCAQLENMAEEQQWEKINKLFAKVQKATQAFCVAAAQITGSAEPEKV